jgi:hypothetical protein
LLANEDDVTEHSMSPSLFTFEQSQNRHCSAIASWREFGNANDHEKPLEHEKEVP